MFWENFSRLCVEHNIKPNPLAKKLGLPSASVTNWKQGRIPHQNTLIKIADYFGVTVDYLLRDDTKETAAISKLKNEIYRQIDGLTDEQAKEVQSFVDYLLSKKKEKKK